MQRPSLILRGITVENSQVPIGYAAANMSANAVNPDVGILAIAYYAPTLCVSAEDVEVAHSSPG